MLKVIGRTYQAWRVYDIESMLVSQNISRPYKIEMAPAQLVRVFGPPCVLDHFRGTSGSYDFEDDNFSLFKLFDRFEVKEFINPRHLLKEHPPYSHRGKTPPFPTAEEFWESDEKYKLWLVAGPYADISSFKRWLRGKLEGNVDVKAEVERIYGAIEYFDDYDKQYEIRRDYAVFKYNKLKWE